MMKTYCPYDRACPGHHIRHLLNLLPIAQRVGHRVAFHDTADTALQDGDAFFDLPGRAPLPFVVGGLHLRQQAAAI